MFVVSFGRNQSERAQQEKKKKGNRAHRLVFGFEVSACVFYAFFQTACDVEELKQLTMSTVNLLTQTHTHTQRLIDIDILAINSPASHSLLCKGKKKLSSIICGRAPAVHVQMAVLRAHKSTTSFTFTPVQFTNSVLYVRRTVLFTLPLPATSVFMCLSIPLSLLFLFTISLPLLLSLSLSVLKQSSFVLQHPN